MGQTPTWCWKRRLPRNKRRNAVDRPYHLLTLSAKNQLALQTYVRRYVDFLAAHPELDLGQLCYTACQGRSHFAYRLCIAADSVKEIRAQLAAHSNDEPTAGILTGVADQHTPPVAFLFTGQGSQYVGMGSELYATQPTFRRALDECAALLEGQLERPLLSVVFGAEAEAQLLDDTAYTQPALFAIEYALATLWQAWGVRPSAVLGHSIGEYAAACVAGVLSLADAVRLVAARGRLMGALAQDGAMVSLQADEVRVRQALAPYCGRGVDCSGQRPGERGHFGAAGGGAVDQHAAGSGRGQDAAAVRFACVPLAVDGADAGSVCRGGGEHHLPQAHTAAGLERDGQAGGR